MKLHPGRFNSVLKSQATIIIGLFPGLMLVAIIALVSDYLSAFIPVGSVVIAIIVGIAVGYTCNFGAIYQSGIAFAEKQLLSGAIMLLGVQLNLSVLYDLGLSLVVFIILLVNASIVVAYLAGKTRRLPSSLSLLLGVGNAICGSSAIAGAAPLLNSKEAETGLSISIVNLLGTAGIFLIPWLTGIFVDVTNLNNGIMIGATLQAVGQVTASGFGINEDVGKIATIVKMGRILMLGPVLLLLSIAFRSRSRPLSGKPRFGIPAFIAGFALFAIAGNLHLLPAAWLPFLETTGERLLIMAMAGVGLRILLTNVMRHGFEAVLVALLVFIFQIGFCLCYIYFAG
jgi:uncharacterized integral membrane protein (TIGR00698 family)